MNRVILNFIGIMLFWGSLNAQKLGKPTGQVYVSYDYRKDNSHTLIVKWIADNVFYPDGFHVYRRQIGAKSGYERVTRYPVKPKTKYEFKGKGKNILSEYMKLVNKMAYQRFQMLPEKAIIAQKAITSHQFADALGVVFYDENVNRGTTYKYKVMGLKDGKEVYVNETRIITSEYYDPPLVPRDIHLKGYDRSVEISWRGEHRRYFGVNIYRSDNADDPGHLVNTLAVPNLNEEHPKFIDNAVMPGKVYYYRLQALDFFGQKSALSDPEEVKTRKTRMRVEKIKFDASRIEDNKVLLLWSFDPSEAHLTIDVMRVGPNSDRVVKLNTKTIYKNTGTFEDVVPLAGNYYYYVEARNWESVKARSHKVLVEIDSKPRLSAPFDLRVTEEDGLIKLNWEHGQRNHVEGFWLECAIQINEEEEFKIILNKEQLTKNSFSFSRDQWNLSKLTFRVRAQSKEGYLSKWSEKKILKPLMKSASPVKAPKGVLEDE